MTFGQDKFHITADRTLYHSKDKVHEASGHVVMTARERRLSSDYAWIDTKTGQVKARGNVVFVSPSWTIQAAELHFNMNTGMGTIFYGVVSDDTYRLKGQLIRKVGPDRFLTTDGEYTTCKDCPESWKMSAKSVDLTIEGYAFLEDVYIIVKDVPTLYLPYMIVPVKTKRQSGLLFPRLGSGSAHGFTFVQPLFLAIDDHQDATLNFGRYTKRGTRGEAQYRFLSYDGIQGTFDGYYISDRTHKPKKTRLATRTELSLPMLEWFDMRLRYVDSSDREYVRTFLGDIPGLGYPALESNVAVKTKTDDVFLAVEGKRFRSIITEDPVNFDKRMVQAYPSAYLGVKERPLFAGFTGSLFARYDRYSRKAGAFFDANENGRFDAFGNDRLREVQRLQLAPELAHSFRIGDIVAIGPSVEYNHRLSFFDPKSTAAPVPTLSSRYVRARAVASTTLERIYDVADDRDVLAYKHQLAPFLT